MAAYCGAIGSVNVLEFVSTDLFDESQENPFLLQQHASNSPTAKLRASPAATSSPQKHASVRFAELPLDDPGESTRNKAPSPTKMAAAWSPPASPSLSKRQSAVVVPTPGSYLHTVPTGSAPPQQQKQQTPAPNTYAQQPPAFSPPASPPATRPSITITLPLGGGFPSTDPNASPATTLAEEAELHKLLYSLTQLGLGQPYQMPQPTAAPQADSAYHRPSMQQQQQPYHNSFASTDSAPTSPSTVSSSSLWFPTASAPATAETRMSSSSQQPAGTASLMFRPLTSRQSRRMTVRQSRRYSSAPTSPVRDASPDGFFQSEDGQAHDDDAYGYGGSQPSSPQRSRGSVTFLTVKNLLRGGGALARTVRREQPNRRPTCMGTVSSRLKRREKFQRPTVITDAYHRVSDMKLGTSPMKVKVKHKAFPELFKTDAYDHENYDEADPGMPSPKGQLRRESLITLETLDKIGTRHACPVQLIDEPLPDFSNIQPRVDAWNHYKKPKKSLRRPSAWLLGATATSTPTDFDG